MKRSLILLTIAMTACTAKAPLSVEVVRSEIARCPEATYLDGMEGKYKWNYTTGLELKAFLDVYEISRLRPSDFARNDRQLSFRLERSGTEKSQLDGAEKSQLDGTEKSQLDGAEKSLLDGTEKSLLEYVDAWYDAIINEDGAIGVNYKRSNYSLDHICPGRTLFGLYDITGTEKYRKAMDSLYVQLQNQPRTPEGGFWHKKIYPQQMWLDGLYMAQPFYAEYTSRYVDGPLKDENYRDIAMQFTLAWDHCYDASTGLLRHAWDSSHEMFWCDPQTGRSAHAWGRACGWYAMALADVIPFMPAGDLQDRLAGMLEQLLLSAMDYADPATGMWYQVLDRPGREGNYIEATVSAMFTYALLKGSNNGWFKEISKETARSKYDSLLKTFVTTGPDGLLNLGSCCEVAGLGGKENRSGSYDYYINEKIRSNDPKGIGPLIWAALEYEK